MSSTREQTTDANASCHQTGAQICVFKNYGFAFSVGLMALASCLLLGQLAKPWVREQVRAREVSRALSSQQALVDSFVLWDERQAEAGDGELQADLIASIAESFSLAEQSSLELWLPSGDLVVHGRSAFSQEDFEQGVFVPHFDSGRSFDYSGLQAQTQFTGVFSSSTRGIEELLVWRKASSGLIVASLQALDLIENRVADVYSLVSATVTVSAIFLGIIVFTIVTVQSRRYQRRIDETMSRLAEALEKNRAQNIELKEQATQLKALLDEVHDLNRILVHDLKTPIGNIESLVTLFEDSGSEEASTRDRYLELMRQSCSHATSLIEGILEIHQLEKEDDKIELKDLELNSLVGAIASNFQEAARLKDIKLSLVTPEQPLQLHSEKRWLGSLLGNLVSNAVKYTHQGGEVRIVTEAVGEQTLVKIQDQGPGFSDEDQSKMFQKFRVLSARPTGQESSHGLGLYAVRKLAERLGARIDFETVLGVGTTFQVWLPRA